MASGVHLVTLSVGVPLMNALLLPIVPTFLFLLARRQPKPFQPTGVHAISRGVIIAVTTALRLFANSRLPRLSRPVSLASAPAR